MTRRLLLCLTVVTTAACSTVSRHNDPYQNQVVNEQRARAASYMELKQYDAAVATLDSLTRARPSDSDLFENLGDAQRGAGNVDRAIKAYEQAIRLNYGAYAPHMKLGTILMENGKTGRALTEFELAVNADDHDVLARYNYGVALYETGRRDEALEQWQIAGEINPENARVAEALAMGYSTVNDSIAVTYFERARKLGADGASFHNNYALLLDRLDRPDEARTHFEQAIEKAAPARRNEYRRNYAVHLLRAGDNEQAAAMLGKLVEQGGGLWSDTVYLARAYLALERYDDAIRVLEPLANDVERGAIPKSAKRIDRMPPTLDEALDTLGMSWRGKGDNKRAVDYLRRAVELAPDNTTHLNNYGVALADGGMLPEARKQWRRVLEIEPQNATAKANLSAFGR